MSKIQQFGRPYETFDPKNKRHRSIFHEALKYRTWGRSPICFFPEDDANGTNSLMDQLMNAVGKYYMEKEFGSLADDEPFEKKKLYEIGQEIRVRPNPHVYKYAK
jgi:hypothetical protein